ncbi:sensor histidine kinase [Nocardioides marmoribigeumensis]|uniref:PAS domain S-box-containing protein n=1 Tax=Nocardioides marmoribigeumensis TaxID=433649 RepID=A0ABU2BYF0_9ACTN|nr:GAF domain-containing protein [Nocardioides marmoribigeumensis]MDR7363415.1 PAS domain S-box-containing protein [Nocardioides marmoribigeumensis]
MLTRPASRRTPSRVPDTAHVPYGEGVTLTRELLDGSPLPTVVFDPEHTVLYANGSFEHVFGYAASEVFGRPYEQLFPERHREELAGRVDEFLAQADPRTLGGRPDFMARRRDGSEFPMQYVANKMTNRHGVWVVVTIFDMSSERDSTARIRSLTRSYRTLARMNQAVVRANDVAELFSETCRVAVDEGGFLGAWVGEPDERGRLRPVALAGSLDAYVDGLEVTTDPALPTSAGPTGTAFLRGVPVVSSVFAQDVTTTPWHERAAEHGIAASVSLPLCRGGTTVAVLSLYAADSGAVGPEARDLLDGLADNVSFALDRFADAARVESLLERVVGAEEDERRRIAADLHDEPVQALAAAVLRLGLVEQLAAAGRTDALEQLREVRDIVVATGESLRTMMFDLDPPTPGTSLGDTVEQVAGQVFAEQPVEVVVDAEHVDLDERVLRQAARILTEALVNVRRHAAASSVHIQVRAYDGGALFTVTDDGRGLDDPRTAQSPRWHRGLRTMADRADLAGGTFRLGASDSGGALVEVWLPGSSQR